MSTPQHVTHGPNFERTGLVHRVRQPAQPGPHPTVVMIQGRAGNEDVMWVFARTLPDDWLLVAPRAIEVDPEEGGYSWHLPISEPWPRLTTFDDGVAALTQFIDALPDLYGAEPEQIFLMGFSQGAAAAYAYALRYPDRVQGIAALVGFLPDDVTAAEAAPLAGMPIFIAAGKEDDTIPLELSRRSADILREAGADVEYHELDTGHKLNSAGMRALKQWWAGRQPD